MGFIQQTPNFSTKRGNIPPDTTFPETNIAPKTGGFQYPRGLFSGAMLVSGRVTLGSCQEVRINGLFHLLTNGVYWGYNPLILTFDPNFQRDIQAGVHIWYQLKQKGTFFEELNISLKRRNKHLIIFVHFNMGNLIIPFKIFRKGACPGSLSLLKRYIQYCLVDLPAFLPATLLKCLKTQQKWPLPLHGVLSPFLSPPDLDQFGNIRNGKNYCWWLKSRTTWNVKKLVNTGRNYLSTGAGFQPSTVSLGNMLHLLENGNWSVRSSHLSPAWPGKKKLQGSQQMFNFTFNEDVQHDNFGIDKDWKKYWYTYEKTLNV